MKKNYNNSLKFDPRTVFELLICSIIIGYSCVHAFSYATTPEHSYTATVTKKENMPTGGGGRSWKPLVFTRLVDTGEVRVFQVTDSISHLRFNSSEVYDSIEVGKTYTFNVYGYSSEDICDYENILSVKETAFPTEEPQ